MFFSPQWQLMLARVRLPWLTRLLGVATTPATSDPMSPRVSIRFPRFAWLLYGAACFLVFLFLTLPTDILLRRVVSSIEHTTQTRLQIGEGKWTWNKGWVFYDLTIEKPGSLLPLHLTRLALSPSLLGLVRGQPFPLTFSAILYGGAASGTLYQEDTEFRVQFVLEQLGLAQWPFPAPWGQGRIAGNVSADGTLQGTPTDITSWSGAFTASLTQGSLKAGNVGIVPLPALQTAQAQARATVKNGRLEITNVTLEADGITAQVQGVLTLRLPLEWSALDLQLITRQTGAASPTLSTLVSLLPPIPGAQGERRATITGTLAAPVMR